MRPIISFLMLFFVSFLANGQARIITGTVIDGFDFEPIPQVSVCTRDTVQLGTGDINGKFKLELPAGTDELLLSFLGMEWTSIKIPDDCKKLEIIMMPSSTYDFITMSKINRIRYRAFKDLKNKHRQAYEKGIFISNTPCFIYIFKKYPSH